MYVRSIRIGRFRHLENIQMGPFPEPPSASELVALAGPNGGGKSSVLELLGYALSSSWSISWQMARSFPESSFEIELGIAQSERKLVQEWIDKNATPQSDEVGQFLRESGSLHRAFNYPSGEHQKNATLQNQLFSIVTSALRGEYQRSLGFFLRSDRYYPQRGFQQHAIFNYQTTRLRTHAWSHAFNLSDVQYQDMFDYLAQLRYHYFAELGAHEHRRQVGQSVGDAPTDPLAPYDQLLQSLFPGYKFAEESGAVPTGLFISLPSGTVLPFNDLSAGEKEVFFILSFFLRHDVGNAIVLIDEPELHLHPELGRTLLQQMMTIRANNQLWVATHNPEIVDEAGRDRVVYISRDRESHEAVITPAVDEVAAVTALRDLFGFSGFIGVARSIVFLEGTGSSSDRKTFSGLFPRMRNHLRFVPAGGVDNQTRLNAAIMNILESNLGWMRFYLIRDRDYLPDDMVDKYKNHPSQRVFVLNRYHIENYLIVPSVLSQVLAETFGKEVSSDQVVADLRAIAVKLTGEVAAGMLSYRLNLLFRAEDFSLGDLLRGQPLVAADGAVKSERVEALRKHIEDRSSHVRTELNSRASGPALEELVESCVHEVLQAIDSGRWISLFPGRAILEAFVRQHDLGKPVVLFNSTIKALGEQADLVPDDLAGIVDAIAAREEEEA